MGFDVVSIKHVSELNKPSHFIALSRNDDEILVVIRGTKSMEDVMTDMVSSQEFLDKDHLYQGIIFDAHVALTLLFSRASWDGCCCAISVQDYSTSAPCLDAKSQGFHRARQHSKKYRMTIVGHSLGAGSASLLACLLVLPSSSPL